MSLVLVTGASGFIGKALVRELTGRGFAVRAADRALVGALGPATDWRAALEGVTQVVHLAGPAHWRALAETYRNEIVGATAALAAQAEAAGVSRFVFVSSVKAVADAGGPYTERDTPRPRDDYGRAKLAAEEAVLARAALGPVALRPPLVHAADAKANFAALLRLADTPLPLPLAGIRNARSLISRDGLIAAIAAVLAAPATRPGAYFVADQPALSIGDIVTALRAGMGRPARLAPGIAALLPRALREDFIIDDSAFRAAYGLAADHARMTLERTGAAWKAAR